ncbi:uncharacterized protein LOC114540939 [Dendronephthya gigantea]|uniref:uncharacterized protein LOC114540939 n=1 Tax=Dendronephthya gigantea TaxID=151771 RepID=UPI001069AA90|nr:uncharacterized protein LOC114540939 [Dendronephthya gigantea]
MDESMTEQDQQQTQDSSGLTCYLHNISEIKNASDSKRKYFNCIVQCADKPVRAVCFSPEKRPGLQALSNSKSPVKLKNYKQSSNTNDDLTITKFTKVSALDKSEVNFAFSEDISSASTGKPVNISAISKLASEQLIEIKGKVMKMSGIKVQSTRFGQVKKQDVIVADPTGTIKLVLWGEYINSLQQNETYTLKNVRVKSTKYDHYLNTPKNEGFVAVDATPYSVPVVEYEDEIDTTSTVNGTIIGVQQASKHIGCNGCAKRNVEIVAPNKAICQFCKLQQLPSTCPVHWSLRILVKPKSGSKNLHLRLDSVSTQRLLEVINPAFQLKTTTEDAITTMILENYQTSLTFTYDAFSYQVSDICRSEVEPVKLSTP